MGTSFRWNAFLGDVTADLRYRLTLCFRSYILPTNMKLAVLTKTSEPQPQCADNIVRQ